MAGPAPDKVEKSQSATAGAADHKTGQRMRSLAAEPDESALQSRRTNIKPKRKPMGPMAPSVARAEAADAEDDARSKIQPTIPKEADEELE